jgi:hypothetical protein
LIEKKVDKEFILYKHNEEELKILDEREDFIKAKIKKMESNVDSLVTEKRIKDMH